MVKSLSVYRSVRSATQPEDRLPPDTWYGHHDGASRPEEIWFYKMCMWWKNKAKPDGNFPTVVYPNRVQETMSIGLKKAIGTGR